MCRPGSAEGQWQDKAALFTKRETAAIVAVVVMNVVAGLSETSEVRVAVQLASECEMQMERAWAAMVLLTGGWDGGEKRCEGVP